ncbi:oligosaccharide flippase family protein [Chitinibacter sp. SCUT-21]|uniref:oligosaccharide flippase family protein n=1 Tax=Chitinibacter sp. SCUT-21 TaxID=2970891 RepID=UPI0035A73584
MQLVKNNKIWSKFTREHFLWVGINQILCRALVAFKFLYFATVFGPAAIGLVGVGLMALAIVESLTDTGLPQAVVQAPQHPNRSALSAVWLIQSIRGLGLSILLFLAASPLEQFFNIDGSAEVLASIAFCPLLRNSLSINYYLQQRNRNFRYLAFTEVSCLILDLGVTLFFYSRNHGVLSLIYGNVAADALRFTVSWMQPFLIKKPDWNDVRKLKGFGNWIWINSIIITIINQFDKVVVAKMLGATSFGSYQMASKVSQMAFVDVASMFAQYLFPTLARLYSTDPRSAYLVFRKIIIILLVFFFSSAVLIYLSIENDLLFFLPYNWIVVLPIVALLLPVMVMAATNGVLSSYLRAIGRPRVVTMATLFQGFVCIPLVFYLIKDHGVNGVILGNTIGMLCSLFYMLRGVFEIRKVS